MLVCQCNQIRLEEIEGAIRDLLNAEAYQLIVPVQVYHFLNKRGRCCGCFPNVVDIIVRVTSEFHCEMETPSAEIIDLVARLKQHHAALSVRQDAFTLSLRA